MTGFDVNVCAAKWKELKVGEHGDIAVEEFLDACDSIISILDAMGSGLGMVKSDMTGNVGHIRRNAAKFGPGVTLQAMVKKDIEDKVEGKDGSTALSLLWLKRCAGVHLPLARRTSPQVAPRAHEWRACALRCRTPRALHFLDQLIVHLLKNAGMEVADAGRAAYADTLTHHHNFAVRQIFKARARARTCELARERYGAGGVVDGGRGRERRAWRAQS